MQDTALAAKTDTHPQERDVLFSRAAFDAFRKLDAERRRLVHLAALADASREIASGIFSNDAGPGLRVVFSRDAVCVSVLALTGREAA